MSDRNLKDLSDEELILHFQKEGTMEAFELLVGRYKNPLFNFVFRFLNDPDLAEDVVQETMIKVYKNSNSYKTIAKFSTWIYTIAGNLAKTELQKRKRRKIFSIHAFGEDNGETYDIPDESSSPERETDSGIKDTIIQNALAQISESYREVVILRDVEGLSYEEISEITGITVGTVKSRINRGRAQLQELLKDIYRE